MTVLRYIVPPEADCQRLGIFLRTQGVTAALIKSVKYNGDGFYADGQPRSTPTEPVHPGQQHQLCIAAGTAHQRHAAARPVCHCLRGRVRRRTGTSPPVSLYIPR